MDDQLRLIKQVIQAEGIDEKRWPARQFAAFMDGWKNKGLTPDQVPPLEARAFGNGKGGELYRAYQNRLLTLNACDFGDLLLHVIRIWRDRPDVLGRLAAPLSATFSSTNIRTPTSASISGCGCSRSAPRTSAASATTTSRSTAGAAPRSTTILRFETRLPRRPGGPARAQLSLDDAYSRVRVASHRPQRGPARQDALQPTKAIDPDAEKILVANSPGIRSEEARSIGDEIESICSARARRLDEIAILVRASFQMREFEDRFVTLGLPLIGSSAARASTSAWRSATPWPISGSRCSRPTISPSSASSTRRSAAWATPPCNRSTRFARAQGRAAARGRAPASSRPRS